MLAATLASPVPTLAQQGDYSTQDVIRFFERGAADAAPSAPPTSICLGTAEECDDPAPAGGTARRAPTVLPEIEAQRERLLDRAPTFDLLVTFELNSARLTPGARERLARFAEAVNSPGLARLRFRIEGHTDALGEDAANLDLSERRAASVVAFLSQNGVDRSRLSAIGFGETRPRESDPYDPRNRRVEGRLLTGSENGDAAARDAG